MRARNSARMHAVARRLAISVALGAVITLLVAWRCHRFAWMEGTRTTIENPEWPIAVPATWPPAPDEAERTEDGSIATESFSIVLPPRSPRLRRPPDDAYFGVGAYESGWPFRACVRYVAHDGYLMKTTEAELGFIRAGVPGPFQLQWSSDPNANRLPILPLWPGFAINTLFYGTLAFAAMAGASAIRRRRRFKRGLCVHCAYPLTGGNVCPECGVAVASTSESSAKNIEPAAPTPV